MPLTKPQRTILDAILFFIRKGEIPTVREVGALVGLRSPATVLKHLRALESQNLISLSGKSRGIRIRSEGMLEEVLGAEKIPERSMKEFPGAFRPMPQEESAGGGLSLPFYSLSPSGKKPPSVPLVGAIAAGKPFESYSEAFLPDGVDQHGLYQEPEDMEGEKSSRAAPALAIDPRLFGESGELMALRIEGDSMINAGILDGDYVIIRRQSTVEEGEIAAVIINGEGTLKRWRSRSSQGKTHVSLIPANERFDPIEISDDDAKDVLVFGKYVGLVRGNLQIS